MTSIQAIRPGAESVVRDATYCGANALARRPVVLAGRFEPSPEAMLVSPAPLFRRPTPAASLLSRAPSGFAATCAPEFRLRLADTGGVRELWTRATDPGAGGGTEEGTRPPVSYATARYHGPDTYSLDPSRGDPVLLRFHLFPPAGEHRFAAAAVRGLAPDHLEKEMLQRIALRPVLFSWCAEVVGEAGEPGPTARHPASVYACIQLGVLRFDRLHEDVWINYAHPRPPADFRPTTSASAGERPAAPLEQGDPA